MSLRTLVVAIGPTEESRIGQLTETVLDVAVPSDAHVVLYHAFSERAFRNGVEEAGYDLEDPPAPERVAERLESVVHLTDELEHAGVDFEVASGVEPVVEGILGVVEDRDADMLFVGGRKRSSTGKAVFGSTSHRVMMNAEAPVVFVRERPAEEEAATAEADERADERAADEGSPEAER